MILLAFDTAMAACSAAVYDASRRAVLARDFRRMERGQANALAPMIRDAMKAAGVEFRDLSRIGVTIGPGSFTGVRTGIAMARGFGVALAKPVVGIDTLTAIAQNAPAGEDPIAVVADARKDEVYAASFAADGSPVLRPAVLSVADALARLPSGARLLGTGASLLMETASPGRFIRRQGGDLPDAAQFAPLCAMRPDPTSPPEPLYLRAIDAKPQAGMAPRAAPSIRPASAAESGVFAAMHAECFDNPWNADDIARLMTMPGAVALIALDGEEPAAFLLARRAADETEILTIGTRPFARRRGLATALIARLESETGGHVFIEVAEGNQAARALYAALGFAGTGLRKNYYERPGGRREHAMVLRKDAVS